MVDTVRTLASLLALEADNHAGLITPQIVRDGLKSAIPPNRFNVKATEYAGGATGDGATDDTAAILACYAACSAAGGGEVVFWPGTYITQELTAPANCMSRGTGIGTTTLKRKAGFLVGQILNTGANNLVEDLSFDGNGIASAGSAEIGSGNAVCYINRVKVTDFHALGIDVYNKNVHIDNSVFYGMGASGLEAQAVWSNASGLGLMVTNCTFENLPAGAAFFGGNRTIIANCDMLNTSLAFTGGCVASSGATGAIVANNTMNGVLYGIELNAATDWLVDANYITNCLGNGIHLANGSTNISITNNVCTYCDNGLGFGSGISLNDANISGIKIIGNSAHNCGFAGLFLAAGTSDNLLVTGNDFRGNASFSIYDGGITGTANVIQGNLPASAQAWKTFTPTLDQAGLATITVTTARYRVVDKIAHMQVNIQVSAVGAAVGNNPVYLKSIPSDAVPKTVGGYQVCGSAIYFKSGTGWYVGSAVAASATQIGIYSGSPASDAVGKSPNITVAANDQFIADLMYEVA